MRRRGWDRGLTNGAENRKAECEMVRLKGRILFLTEDPELIKKQLAGGICRGIRRIRRTIPSCATTFRPTRSRRRTICFYFDETLGEIPYVGLKCGNELPIKRGDVKRGGFVACVSGKRRGKGSSREHSPYAEMSAGIQLVIAREHRADLQAELPEPGPADVDGLRDDRQDAARRRDAADANSRKARTRSRGR